MDKTEQDLREELERRAAEEEAARAENPDGDGSGERRRHHHHHHHHHSGKKRRKRRRHHHGSSERKRRRKHIIIVVLTLALTAVIVLGASFFAMYRNGRSETMPENYNIQAPTDPGMSVEVGKRGDYVVYNGERYNLNKDIINMLFLGIDKKDSSEGQSQIGSNHQCDMIMVCAIDKKNGKITMINVPRDIITDVGVYSPGGGYVGLEKLPIALSFAYGDGEHTSCVNSKEAVMRLFYNMPVSTYISLNLDGLEEINDAVGGVDVVSPETIAEFVEGEEYHLNGLQAHHFVNRRAMDRPDANLLRNKRQKVYMQSFFEKVLAGTKSDISLPVNLFNAAAPYSCTNINADRVAYLVTEFIVNRSMKIDYASVPVDVATKDGNVENYVKEAEFYELFLDIFYEKEE